MRALKEKSPEMFRDLKITLKQMDNVIREWESKGGIGIHHTDVSKTLRELSNLGFK